LVKIAGKRDSLLLFFIFFYLPSIALFLLSGSKNLSEWISTSFFIILTVASLVVLGLSKSDEKYYENLNLWYFITAIGVGIGMIALSWGLSIQLKNPNMLLSVSAAFPIPGLEASSLSLTPIATSVGTLFLSTILYGLVMAATSEELFKLAMFSEGQSRWGKGYKLGRFTIPGVFIFVAFPVGIWALLHGIQSYANPVMIFPAAVNGIVLIIYLWKTRCILGCIFAHWIYNSGIVFLTYINGSASIASGTPFLPNIFDRGYYSNSGFINDFLLILLLVGVVLFFLVPSITEKRGMNKR
jgi:hypothetical protein